MTIATRETNRFEAMRQRANRILQDGYTLTPFVGNSYQVASPEAAKYVVDLRDRTCECPSFQKGEFRDERGTCCKHIIACEKLDQERRNARKERVLKMMRNDF